MMNNDLMKLRNEALALGVLTFLTGLGLLCFGCYACITSKNIPPWTQVTAETYGMLLHAYCIAALWLAPAVGAILLCCSALLLRLRKRV